jgi:hypothetical protein
MDVIVPDYVANYEYDDYDGITYCIQVDEDKLSPFATHTDIRRLCNPRGLSNPHHTKNISREKAENMGLDICEKCKDKLNGESRN